MPVPEGWERGVRVGKVGAWWVARTEDGLGKGAGEGDLAARGGGEGDEEERAECKDGEPDLQLLERELVLPAVVQKGELHREEDGQDGLQQPRHHAGVVEVLGDQLASREAKLGRRVEAADDDVRGEAREALSRRGGGGRGGEEAAEAEAGATAAEAEATVEAAEAEAARMGKARAGWARGGGGACIASVGVACPPAPPPSESGAGCGTPAAPPRSRRGSRGK